MKIKVGFSKHKGFAPLSWLIMLVERTGFSHAYVKIKSESLDRDLVYQATGAGVYFVGTEIFEEKNLVVKEKEFLVSDSAKVKFLQWAVDNSGKSYSIIGVLGLGVKRLASIFGIKINNPFQKNDSQYFCTKLVAYALEELSFQTEDEDDIGLKELDRIVDELNGQISIPS